MWSPKAVEQALHSTQNARAFNPTAQTFLKHLLIIASARNSEEPHGRACHKSGHGDRTTRSRSHGRREICARSAGAERYEAEDQQRRDNRSIV